MEVFFKLILAVFSICNIFNKPFEAPFLDLWEEQMYQQKT